MYNMTQKDDITLEGFWMKMTPPQRWPRAKKQSDDLHPSTILTVRYFSSQLFSASAIRHTLFKYLRSIIFSSSSFWGHLCCPQFFFFRKSNFFWPDKWGAASNRESFSFATSRHFVAFEFKLHFGFGLLVSLIQAHFSLMPVALWRGCIIKSTLAKHRTKNHQEHYLCSKPNVQTIYNGGIKGRGAD